METVGELLKAIRKNTDTDFVKVSGTPKRCVLNNYWDLVDIPGMLLKSMLEIKKNTMYL